MKDASIHIKERIRGIVEYVGLYLYSLIFYFNTNLCVWCNKGVHKMKKGFTIDCNYIIRVSKLMRIAELPRPTKKLLDSDGTILPLITVETET